MQMSVVFQVHWTEPQHGSAESVHVSRCYGECIGAVVQLVSQVCYQVLIGSHIYRHNIPDE